MIDIYNWIMENWVEVGAALGLLMGASRIIVKLTPTTKDDQVFGWIVKALSHLGLAIPDKKNVE